MVKVVRVRAEGSQITTLCGIFGMWHSIPKQIECGIHFVFLCLQVHFPDVERVEWLNKVRSSELQSVRLCALSWIPAQTLSLRRLVSHYNKVQSQQRLYLSFGTSRVVTSLGESQMCAPGWCRCDEFDHTASFWDFKTKSPCAHVYTCTYVFVAVLLF